VVFTTYKLYKSQIKPILAGLLSILLIVCPGCACSIVEKVLGGELLDTTGKKKEIKVQKHKSKGLQINIDNARFVDKETLIEVKDISVEIVSNKVADILVSTNITKVDFKVATHMVNFDYKGKLLNKAKAKFDVAMGDIAFFAAFALVPAEAVALYLRPELDKYFKNASDFVMNKPPFRL
jgi:hypothetical protein